MRTDQYSSAGRFFSRASGPALANLILVVLLAFTVIVPGGCGQPQGMSDSATLAPVYAQQPSSAAARAGSRFTYSAPNEDLLLCVRPPEALGLDKQTPPGQVYLPKGAQLTLPARNLGKKGFTLEHMLVKVSKMDNCAAAWQQVDATPEEERSSLDFIEMLSTEKCVGGGCVGP